ncbi:TraB/GumN family protein [Thiolapillus brandeum]|uniref:TraB/GumN family protein n=1 Tax=Thiolapillus brandeum TaxID=1076588 RepID=UPI000697C15E|nr:TraB/GumN family protein [Thiolapillus brandeum]
MPSLEPGLVFHDLSPANGEGLKYARLEKSPQGKPVALQTAVVRMVPGDGSPDIDYVDLVGAVHIGEHRYYQQINGLFRRYDVVLYELVAPRGTRIPRGGGKNHSVIGNLQSGMRKVLGLGLQLEDVDYHLPNLVHADLTPDEFFESMARRNESVAGMLGRAWLAGMGRQRSPKALANQMNLYRNLLSGDSDKALKIWFANEMVEMSTMQHAIEGKNGSTLLAERNRKAVQVLRQEIARGHRRIAIFYGAAHLSGIQKLLEKDLGLVPAKIAWLNAWDLN